VGGCQVVEWLRYTSPGCLAASRERHEGDGAALHDADFHLFRDIHKAVLAAPWPLYQARACGPQESQTWLTPTRLVEFHGKFIEDDHSTGVHSIAGGGG
jgi:hypothetical protein